MRNIAILGSTGSIGQSTLSVIASYPDRFHLVSLAAGHNVKTALEQAKRWKPRIVSTAQAADSERLAHERRRAQLGDIEVTCGAAGSVRVATHPEVDFVVSAIV